MRGGPGLRRWGVTLLVVTGVLLTTVGAVATYARQVLFDRQSFSVRAGRAMSDPAVAELLADRISRAAVEANRDLTPYRPLIFSGARGIVESNAFASVTKRSAEAMHFVIFSQGGKDLLLSLSDVGTLLQSALPALPPGLAGKIPEDLVVDLAKEIRAPERLERDLSTMRRLAGLSGYAPWTWAAGVLCLIAAALLSPAPRRIGRTTGWLLFAVAALLALLPALGALAIRARIADPEVGAAAAGLWRRFLFDAWDWALVIGSVALVLLSTSRRIGWTEAREVARRAGRCITQKPAGRLAQLGRAAVLIGLGYGLIRTPEATLRGAVILLGVATLYLGLSTAAGSLFELESEPHEGEARRGRESPRAARLVALTVATALMLLAASWLFPHRRAAMLGLHFGAGCNGAEELCGKHLDEVVFPTTHNSMASSDVPTWFFPAQEAGIRAQLEDGIRGFQIDAYYGYRVENRILTVVADESDARKKYESVIGKEGVDAAFRIRERLFGAPRGEKRLYLCHAFCELGAIELSGVFRAMREFLQERPREVLMIVIQDEDVLPDDIAGVAARSGLLDHIYRGPVTGPWPTLDDMIRDKQQVLVFAENRAGDVPWYHQAFDVFQETPFDFRTPDDFSCEPWRGGTKGTLFQFNHWITRVPAPNPRDAAVVNAYDFLMARVRKCYRTRHKLPNLLAVDFYRTGDLFKVVERLNRYGIE